jgi:hypothetical protein
MKTNGTTHAAPTGSTTPTTTSAKGAGEQLSLLSAPSVPLQFRLDERTRRSGLQHIEALRAQIAAQVAARAGRSGRNGAQPKDNSQIAA